MPVPGVGARYKGVPEGCGWLSLLSQSWFAGSCTQCAQGCQGGLPGGGGIMVLGEQELTGKRVAAGGSSMCKGQEAGGDMNFGNRQGQWASGCRLKGDSRAGGLRRRVVSGQ